MRPRRSEQYAYLRDDKEGALQQIEAELRTALDLGMVSGVATTLCRGLVVKCMLGLNEPAHIIESFEEDS